VLNGNFYENRGRFSDAARALTEEQLSPLNDDTIRILQEKFPPAPDDAELPPPIAGPDSTVISSEIVCKSIMSFPRGSGAGLSGVTPDLLKLALSAASRAQRGEELLTSLTR
jgi:hypothetical protein